MCLSGQIRVHLLHVYYIAPIIFLSLSNYQ